MSVGVATKAGGSLYRRFGKRAMDALIAGVALVATAPVMALIALMIAVRMGRPVLFSQVRPGRNGEPFRLYKFRTMSDARDPDGELLPDGERLTGLGRALRRTSLDELPELYNVLRGDMSLVGPRPLLLEYLDRYTPRQARRHEVRPGITGWAQVTGRNQLSWTDKFECDVWYVDHLGLGLDLKILCRTAREVLAGRNVNAEGHVTMPRFQGPEGDR